MQTDMNPQIGRGACFFQDFVEFFKRIHREVADAIVEIGFANGFAAFHGMHEGHMGVVEHAVNQTRFAARGNVEMTNACGVQLTQNKGIRVNFDGIERGTRKMGEEKRGVFLQRVGIQAMNRLARARFFNHIFDTRKTGQSLLLGFRDWFGFRAGISNRNVINVFHRPNST